MIHRDDEVENRLHMALLALRSIADDECRYSYDPADERPNPCACYSCTARAALGDSDAWRFRGSFAHRLGSSQWPRETAIVAAWESYASRGKNPDHVLGQILDDNPDAQRSCRGFAAPTVRVATSVIQWLATNCGCSVLSEAGFAVGADRPSLRELERQREAHRDALNRIADKLGVVHEDEKIVAAVLAALTDARPVKP